MPIYEFVCEACGRIVERLQKVTDPPPEGCPECNGKMAKIMSRNSFQLKGGGWYKDLYSSAAGGGSKGTGASAPSSETAPASTPSPSTGGAPPSQAPAPASTPAAAPAATPKKD